MKIARILCPNIVTIKASRSNNEGKFRHYVSWLYLEFNDMYATVRATKRN
jgi:hypothetical protein